MTSKRQSWDRCRSSDPHKDPHGLYLTTCLSLTLLLIIKELSKEETYKSSFKICSPCLVILFYDFSAENGSGLANTPDY